VQDNKRRALQANKINTFYSQAFLFFVDKLPVKTHFLIQLA
jgi:hypothetical protein